MGDGYRRFGYRLGDPAGYAVYPLDPVIKVKDLTLTAEFPPYRLVNDDFVVFENVRLNGQTRSWRLVEKAHVFIFDAWIDALDDVADVLVRIS